MIMTCAIVDDEALARKLLEDHIAKLPNLALLASVKSPLLLTEALADRKIDLLFMDIQMPDIKGTSFVKTLQNKPLVIFTTAYPEYALEGFELDAIDYLVKPISFERFLHGYQKAQAYLRPAQQPNPAINLDEKMKEQTDYIIIKADHKLHKVKHQDILYIEGLKEYVSFFTRNGKRIIALESLKKLEEQLPESFMRIHKSYIINLHEMESMEGNMVHIAAKTLPVGGSYKELLIKSLFH
ncbi:MAG: DNA-binding LytR/AlgR family response regulator [Marivirga sp.]|jgi:DNA-binding LytR/AlgR family response regulator